jgi:hypothetical protein
MKIKMYRFLDVVAVKYGVDAAIFIQNLFFWINKNTAEGRNLKDSKHWMYMTGEQFKKLFPFWSISKIYDIARKLEKQNVIVRDNKYDKTYWYSFSDFATWKSIFDNMEILEMEMEEEVLEIGSSENPNSNNEPCGTIPYPIPNIRTEYDTPLFEKNILKNNVEKTVISTPTDISTGANLPSPQPTENNKTIDELIEELTELILKNEHEDTDSKALQSFQESASFLFFINSISTVRQQELKQFCNKNVNSKDIANLFVWGKIKKEIQLPEERLFCLFKACEYRVSEYLLIIEQQKERFL